MRVVVMNPNDKKTSKGGKTMAKKRVATKRRKPRSDKGKKRKVRRNPASMARYRRKAQNTVGTSVDRILKPALGTLLGFVGIRSLVNYFLPTQTGYMKAAATLAGAVLVGTIGRSAMKGKNKIIADYVAIGGTACAALIVIDQVTDMQYRQYYNLGKGGNNVYKIPPRTQRLLPSGMSDYTRKVDTGLSDYGISRTGQGTWSNKTWRKPF